MTDSPTAPAVLETDTTPATPAATPTPSAIPAVVPQAAAEPADGADDILDILGTDDGEELAGEAEQPDEDRAPLKPWTPPDGQEVHEHARPHLAALDGIATDEVQRDRLVGLYNEMVQAQTARLAELSATTKAETVKALKAELGGDFAAYRGQVDDAFKALPSDYRAALKGARLADGRLLLSTRAGIDLLHRLGDRQTRHADWRADQVNSRDKRSMLQAELAELNAIRDRDISELHRPWRDTGMSGSDRAYAIMKELNGDAPKRPSASTLRSEEAELIRLYETDPQIFEYALWRDSGLTGAERLTRIRQGRV
jgi:hypothetical protein